MSGRHSALIRSHDGSLGRPLGGVQLLGGPSKWGPIENTWNLTLATGLVKPDPSLTAPNEAGSRSNGLRPMKDSGWAKAKDSNEESRSEEFQGPFQSLIVGRA